MEVIFLIGSAQAIFLALLVFNKKQKGTADYVLGAWMIFIGLHLLNFYLFTTGFMFKHPHLLGIGIAFPQLEAPFMFVYVLLMISEKGKFKAAYLWHGLVFLITIVFLCFDFYFLSADEKLIYYEKIYTDLPLDLWIFTFPSIILGPIYVVWSLIKLRQHSKKISQQFSYKEQINLNWLKYVIVGLGFVYLTVIISNVLVRFPFLSIEMHEQLNYLAVTIAVFFLGYFGIKQQAIYTHDQVQVDVTKVSPQQKKVKNRNQYLHSGLKKQDAKNHLNKLLDFFESHKPFLNGKLTLSEVASHLDISTNHLSQVINEHLDKSFFDFVNEYRIDEVKSRLQNAGHQNFTLLAIAYDSGFNSKSSFNSIFKKTTGITPSEYIKKIST